MLGPGRSSPGPNEEISCRWSPGNATDNELPGTIDLHHAGIPGAIAAYVVLDPEPTIIDPGPESAFDELVVGLDELGVGLQDVGRVVLTHIHLDHAGATGRIVQEAPRVTVHVHEDGAPHLVDPDKLIKSTRRTFGERSDELWGETLPVPASRIRGWRLGDPESLHGLRVLPSPGHIAHHLAFQDEQEGTLFAGDAMGILLNPEGPVHPPTPPPSLDLEAWYETLTGWAGLDVPRFAATHFGVHQRFHDRRVELLARLEALEARVASELEADIDGSAAYGAEVVDRMSDGGSDERVVEYYNAFPADAEWHGAAFHLKRRTAD
ncbi:MAG: MBL fold metallo-hydrolase [Longimicrobiales bacterium]